MLRVSRMSVMFAYLAIFACGGLLLGQLAGCAPPEPRPEPRIDAVDPEDEPVEPTEPVEPVEPTEPDEPVIVEPEDEPAEPMADATPEPVDFDTLPVDAPVSTYAPAQDLLAQVDQYMARMEEVVANADEYQDGAQRLARDSNTMIVIALALGMHDEDHQLKAHAPAILQAAQAVAATEDYEAAKQAVEDLKQAIADGGEGPELQWEKVASLKELMEQVPLINTSINRRVRRRFERNVDDIAGDAAAIAVIGQGTLPNADDTIAPERADEWIKYSIQMRNAAAELRAAARAVNEDAAQAAFEKLGQSCDDCHAVFHPEELN